MRTTIVTLAALLSLAVPAGAKGTPVRLATWNLENLFDERDDPDREDPVPSPREVEQKLANLAAVLRDLGGGPPEILAVQEVETADLLERLGRLVHGDRPFQQRHARTNDARGIGVGLLTTWRVLDQRVVDRGEPGSRPILAARLAPPGDGPDLDLIVVHWKSMRRVEGEGPLEDDRRRWRQARATRAVVDGIRKARPTARIAVAGDFNADVGALALARGLGAASDPDGVRAVPEEGLLDATFRIAPSARGTTHWQFNAPPSWAAWATLDHVLLSASLLEDGPLRFDEKGGPQSRGATVVRFARQPERFRAPADLPAREGPPGPDLALGASDHFPVVVWLRLR